ncbi:MAG: gamma carbonic anhydrase family protein [Actinomycetota bacterium]|nr:gamma carbonic anhydrase family protein [Actinomycetota bacterium]
MPAERGEEPEDLQQIHPTVWRAPGVQIYGKVTIEAEASLWPNVVIRAECHDVHIGRYSNLQDFVMVHVGYDAPTRVGEFCSITHHATIHGCTIEDHCLVGINACIMDGAVIGRGSIVAGNAMVKEGSTFPPGSIIAGVPAKQIAERDMARDNRFNAWLYHRNKQAYERGDHRTWVGEEYKTWRNEKRRQVDEDRDLLGL